MSIISDFMKNFTFGRGDDEFPIDDEGYDFENGYDDEPPEQRPIPFLRKNLRDNDYSDPIDDSKPRFFSRNKSTQQSRRADFEVTMIKPTSMDDSREICDYLLSGKAVVLNMEGLHMEIAQRIIDFSCGAAYSINGRFDKISKYIFIATPDNVDLTGDFQNILSENAEQTMGGLNLRA